MIFLLAFTLALILSLALVPVLKYVATKYNIVDLPGAARKIHKTPIPLLGGTAIFIAFFAVIALFGKQLVAGDLNMWHWLGFFIGSLVLIVGGIIDDKYNLKPYQQFIFPILAIISVLLGGVEIAKLSNPFGGTMSIAWLSPVLIFCWLLGMMYTTKLLDGVDGLVGGVSLIGVLVIFLFTLTSKYYQPDIALAAAVLAGAILGFLFYNFNPASIFLGEGGSLFLGFALGVLAIISGGKIAIALLVMGVPILDVAWTIFRRLLSGKNPFKSADKKHLHHRLLALGLSQKQTVFVFYILSATFGALALLLQSRGKLMALGLLVILMLVAVIIFSFFDRKKKLLLHVCCAPCSAYISRDILMPEFDLTLYFYNSNLDSFEEYSKRLGAVSDFAARYKIPLIIEPYVHNEWLDRIKGQEQTPERGARCVICYRDRLDKIVQFAKQNKFDLFTTSLLVSPYKDSVAINNISRELSAKYGVAFLEKDFQADNGFYKSQAVAKELNFYRQKYCGCEFSKK
jgi:UDP-GlcNAc:undecaprenyl-phosphate GlcNAc-1-phosphate transferase